MSSRFRSVLVVVLLLVLVACSSTRPPDRIAFSTLESIKTAAEATMRVHAFLYTRGLSSPERRVKVDAAYDAVRATCNTAALGIAAVKTWADVVSALEAPKAALVKLKELVPEDKEPLPEGVR